MAAVFLLGDRVSSAVRPGEGRNPLVPPNFTWETNVFRLAPDVSGHETLAGGECCTRHVKTDSFFNSAQGEGRISHHASAALNGTAYPEVTGTEMNASD